MTTNNTIFGAFLVYADASFCDLENECKTAAGARRTIARLRRKGFAPAVRRHATDGAAHWNVDIDADTLAVIPPPMFELRGSFAVEPKRIHTPDLVHAETAYGSATRLTFAVLCF